MIETSNCTSRPASAAASRTFPIIHSTAPSSAHSVVPMSPSRPATPAPRGPNRPRSRGTFGMSFAQGRTSGPGAPSTSTGSPAIHARMSTSDFSYDFQVAGFQPSIFTELSPRPMPRNARPSDITWSVAIVLAVTLGCRVSGFVTSGPRWIREVSSAATPKTGYMSMKL